MASPDKIPLSLHNKQQMAFRTMATEVLYGGAAGGGKSHLMRVASIIWCLDIPGLQVYLFRRLSDDLYKNHMTGPGSYPELMGHLMQTGLVKYNGSKNFLEFWNGSRIWMCHCQYEKDMYKYQGAEIHVLMMDELTHFSEVIYRYLRGRVRLGGLKIPPKWKGLFPRILCGSNPGGLGHTWVRRFFINISATFKITQMAKEDGGFRRQYIPAVISDNPTLEDNDPGYVDRLRALGNPALVRAMLYGDWNIVSGGALDDLWDDMLLVVPRFVVPAGWRLDRSFDWGSSSPFSVGWWAEADGTEAYLETSDGDVVPWCPPKGTLVRIYEWYGSVEVGSNAGLKMSARDIARGIKLREEQLKEQGWILTKVESGPADNQIAAVVEKESDSIASKMAKEGVKWKPSDKKPGSRVVGLQLIRDRLQAAKTGEGPALYFCDCCNASLGTLPVLPRDPKNEEDVDTDAEDHVYDDIRYRVLSNGRRYAKNVRAKHPT